jgi:hypothetical protein
LEVKEKKGGKWIGSDFSTLVSNRGFAAPCAPNVRRTVDVVVSAPGYANATVSLDVDCEGRGGAMAEVLLAKN